MKEPTTDRRDEVLQDIEALDLAGHDESAVREEVIVRMLALLGYRRCRSPTRISIPVKLPYVQLGREERRISKRPDYVLYVDDRPAVVVEAKPPTDLVDFKSAQQCLSYAVHEEVQALLGVVINGNELAVYRGALHPEAREPLLRLPRAEWRSRWPDIERVLHPGSIRLERAAVATKLMRWALPVGKSVEATLRVVDQEPSVIELAAPGGLPLRVELQARTERGEQILAAARDASSPGEVRIDSADVAVAVGEERLSLNEFWGPKLASLLITSENPNVDLYLLAPDGPTGVRAEGRLKSPEEGLLVLGDPEHGLRLEIRRGSGASIALAPGRLPLLLGLRSMEFMQALEKQGELVVVDADSLRVVLYGRGTFSAGVQAEFVDLLRKLTYVCLRCRVHDLMTPVEVMGRDATTVDAMYRLLKGERVWQRGHLSGLPPEIAESLGPGAELSLKNYDLAAMGRDFVLGDARVDVSAVEGGEEEGEVIVEGTVTLDSPAPTIGSKEAD